MTTRERRIQIDVESGQIDATLVAPGTKIPGVLFLHGWGASQQQYLARARGIAALGSVCLTLDFSGHVGTRSMFEKVSRATNLRDALAGYDVLASHPLVDEAAIGIVGSSYGGYLAAIVTSMRPVKWLGMRVPALYMDTGWEIPKLQLHVDQDLRSYRRSLVPAESNRALRACEQFAGDVLLVESEHDDVVPAAVVASYRAAFLRTRSLTYRCIPGADHGLSDDATQNAYTAILTQWMHEMLVGARGAADSADAQRPESEIATPGESARSPRAAPSTPQAHSLPTRRR